MLVVVVVVVVIVVVVAANAIGFRVLKGVGGGGVLRDRGFRISEARDAFVARGGMRCPDGVSDQGWRRGGGY